jgi:hypothetical protein
MRYPSIEALDNRIEKIIDSTVKHYYTDWKNYDRPKYMKFKGSADAADKDLILIARECGTYLIRTEDIKTGNEWAKTLVEYFQTQESADYYHININKLEVKKIDPAEAKKAA